MITPQPARTRHTLFLRRHGQRLLALLFWALLLGGYSWYAAVHELTPRLAVQRLIDLLADRAFGPVLFVAVYTIRPVILFPATLLTVGAGYLYGATAAILYTILGANAGASLAYLIGRYFGQGFLDNPASAGLIQRYADRLRRNGFEAVLTMRFLFLPYDLVSYLAGFLRVNWRAFILATIVGSLPGTISFALFGAAIEGDFAGGAPGIDVPVLVASAIIFLASLGLSRLFRRREERAGQD